MTASDPQRSRLRWLLLGFFVALAIPSLVLTWQAYSRLQWEAFHQYQVLAQELLGRVDGRMRELVSKEAERAFTDYRFLVVEGAPAAGYLQRSPLSRFPVDSGMPGLLGHFQVDAEGRFTSPLLPEDGDVSPLEFGIPDDEFAQRQALRDRMLQILQQQGLLAGAAPVERVQADAGYAKDQGAGLVSSTKGMPSRDLDDAVSLQSEAMPAPAAEREERVTQSVFDDLRQRKASAPTARKRTLSKSGLGRVDELQLEQAFEGAQAESRRLTRKKETLNYGLSRREQNVAPAAPVSSVADAAGDQRASGASLVRFFESEIEPFEFAAIGDTYFVLYRQVWREGRRLIQGALIERAPLLRALVETPFHDSVLSGMSRLGVAYDGEILAALGDSPGGRYPAGTDQLSGTLLYRGRLTAPLGGMELIYTVTTMPTQIGGSLVFWTAAILGLVLCAGVVLLYRLGLRQIALNRQQRDFVSAVSHELKTPLTSIRMYSEMLREGWADESRKRSYYDFIYEESERLSRLIANVLQLARMGRDELRVEPHEVAVGTLIDLVHSKVASQVERAGFALELSCDEQTRARRVSVDEDALVQVLINLVDNALKFSARAEQKQVELGCRSRTDRRVEFFVADRGPGVGRDQMKKIFTLFYRGESELTRETVGTGIGLALVQRLTTAMAGEVDVINRRPGAEFQVRFPLIGD